MREWGFLTWLSSPPMTPDPTDVLHLADLEAAINHWRARCPSPDGVGLTEPLRALATLYGQMVWARASTWPASRLSEPARAAWLAWYAQTPDTPCIAICSTSQGDAVCKGCGRTFAEVQNWTALGPWAKRSVWRRLIDQASAWRFNRYAERS